MINIRKADERGKTQIDWLESHHSFSFGDYYDQSYMGFSDLRVINEDFINANRGFGAHPHKNMEIITYVVEGALEHKDSLGTGSIIRPGEIQRMSAGTGIQHSEFNPSNHHSLHLLQIWILPETIGITPGYEQKQINKINNQLILIGSQDIKEEAVTIHQDVKLFVAFLTSNHSVSYDFKQQRQGWIQLIKGQIEINGQALSAGDGASISRENTITITCLQDAELLFFDLRKIIS
jgi:redox-sensitive bicupin YhaK (pirin superfamily)